MLRLTPRQYEDVRANPRWFIVAPGHHANAQGWSRIVAEHARYVIVEKVGEAGEVVAQLDPRTEGLEQAAEAEQERRWRLARTVTFTALTTALRRGELLALRWKDSRLLEHQLDVREAIVKGRFTTPKSSASRRLIELDPQTQQLLSRHCSRARSNADEELVFCHPLKGTPLDPSKLARCYLRQAGIEKPFRPFHDLRHTALTHEAAAGNPMAHIQQKAGHSQSSITERYIHAAQTSFPGAAAKGEEQGFL
jgi:integrase